MLRDVDEAIKLVFVHYEVWLATLDTGHYSAQQISKLEKLVEDVSSDGFDDFVSVSFDRQMKWFKVLLKSEVLLFAAGTINRLRRDHP